MIDEQEIWACANMLIRQHGTDAWFWAAQRADALLAEGKVEGHATFLRILRRIEDLERTAPTGLVH